MAYTGVTLVAVTGGTTKLVPPGVLVEGATEVLLLTRVRRHTGELDVVAEGRALRDLLDGTEYDALLARHLEAHRTAYRRVTLDLAADPAERALPAPRCWSARTAWPCWNASSRPAATTCSPPAGCSRPA